MMMMRMMMRSFVFALVGLAASCSGDDQIGRNEQKVSCGGGGTGAGVQSAACQQACGGAQGLLCPTGSICVDDPSDSCDPKQGGSDCIGICVSIPCGGLRHLVCPSGLTCVDDPSDACDPMQGGSDCPAFCQ
jgi:hypothetical protein